MVAIVLPRGNRVVALRFTRAHAIFALGVASLAFVVVTASYVWTIARAEARVSAMRSLSSDEHARLHSLDAQAAALGGQVRALQRQNAEIEWLIGARRTSPRAAQTRSKVQSRGSVDGRQAYREDDDFATVAARIERLRATSSHIRVQSAALRRLAIHVLNMRRLQDLARVRVLAAIPSLNPAGDGVAIRSPFGWRADPWPEFHQGVDLDVDYGDNVRAAAAGTVVAADYDGGFGIKVDIDHGNGYHTWYAHLSRADVTPGQHVAKGQHIALVGSTGESTGPHLHYQVMLDGKPIDPTPYLDGVPAPVLASIRS